MDMQTFLNNFVHAERVKAFNESDQLSLGELIRKCEEIAAKGRDEPPWVEFDFCGLRPTTLESWRGIYAELALDFDENTDYPELPAFIAMLKSAVGATFNGYKGGDFKMSLHTPVWVAHCDRAGNTAIIDVVDDGFRVVLITGYREA